MYSPAYLLKKVMPSICFKFVYAPLFLFFYHGKYWKRLFIIYFIVWIRFYISLVHALRFLVVVLLLSLTENVAKNWIELKRIMRELLDKLANLLFVISLVTLVGSLIFVDTELLVIVRTQKGKWSNKLIKIKNYHYPIMILSS